MILPLAWLKTFIYLISSSLFLPDLILLAVIFLYLVIYAGGFCAQWLERSKLKNYLPTDIPQAILQGETSNMFPAPVQRYLQDLEQILATDQYQEINIENLLQETTLRLWKKMDRLRILVRIGPSLGLIGTLIPMGTGLAALGQGDLSQLSADLVVAFTTTVVGLATGMTAFFFYTIKRRWTEQDIKNMELITELLTTQQTSSQPTR